MSVQSFVKGLKPEVKPAPTPTFNLREIMENARLQRVEINKIKLPENHPFEEYEDFAMNDLIEEIRDNGVIMPILLRDTGEGFEVIDGRARFVAAQTVGDTTIDAKIIECSDDEAREMIAFSLKVFQRSFRDMPLTQQARLVVNYYDSIKRQGKRNDLSDRMAAGERIMPYDLFDEYSDARGVGRYAANRINGQKLRSKDVRTDAAARYGLSGRNLARFVRIDQMQDSLKVLIDNETIGFTAAVELSFLNERQQNWVAEAVADGAKITVKNAGKLKDMHLKRRKNQGSEPFLNRPRLRKILGIKPPPVATKIGLAPEADATDESMKNAYVQINVEEYMKNRFPYFFPEDGTSSLNADEKLIHYLISFYVRIKDSLCALFPTRFNPDITDVDILNTLFKVVVVYFDGRESGVIKAPHPLYGLDL